MTMRSWDELIIYVLKEANIDKKHYYWTLSIHWGLFRKRYTNGHEDEHFVEQMY